MVETSKTIHEVQIYAPGGRWTGQLVVASWQRLSDFLNDRGTDFVELEHATLIQWGKEPAPTLLRIERVALNKPNAIAICGIAGASPAREDSPDRVIKAQRRVKIVAPPLILTGDFHVPHGADWLNMMNLAGPRFLSFTDVSISSLDPVLALDSRAEFALVNRQSIVAIGAWG